MDIPCPKSEDGQWSGDLPGSDEDLVRRAAGGSQEAFERLIVRHREMIYRVARKLVRNDEDALDVTQEVFRILVQRIGDYRGEGSARGWILVISVNEARSYIRKAARRRRFGLKRAAGEAAPTRTPRETAHSSGIPADLMRKEFDEVVRRAVEELPPQQKAICLLRFLDDMGPTEVGRALAIPPAQVRSQFARAVRKLRGSEVLRSWLARSPSPPPDSTPRTAEEVRNA